MRVSIVVIAAENGTIGRDNAMPWHLPDDLKHFKQVTMGKPIVMGRKTFESIGRPLPGRTSIVVTRQASLAIPNVIVVNSLTDALQAVQAQEVAVVGGAEIYRQALPLTDVVYLTRVHASIDGDVFFPELSATEWREIERTEHPADARHAYDMSFITLERRR